MKTWRAIIVLVLGWLLAVPVKPVEARSYYSERFDVLIDLQENSSFIVTETVVFYFEGGAYTYAFRNLELNELDRIEILEASMDGQVLPKGTSPGQVEIKTSLSPIEITWHFLPTSDASHTFTLVYRVEGNVRRVAGLDGLSWRAIPENHEYDIRSSSITVLYPPGLTPAGKPGLDGAPYQVQQSPGKIVFTALDISKDTALVVDVRFPPGSLIDQPPAWQAAQIDRSQQTGAGLPYALAGGGGFLTIVLVAVAIFRRRNLPKYERSIASGIITSPPDDLAPAKVGYLSNNIQASLMHGFATLLDLTRRGWLQMQEDEGKGLFKAKDFLITQKKTGPGLKLHEMVFLDFLASIHRGQPIHAKLSEIGAKFNSRLHIFVKGMRSELLEAGLIESQGVKRRSQIGAVGLTLLFFGILLGVFGGISIGVAAQRLAFWGTIMLGLSFSLILAAIVLWIQANNWPVLTQAGAARLEHWISFRDYLKELVRTKVELRDEWLDEYLPYAVAFNLGDRWVKAYKDRGLSTALPWVLATQGGYADGMVVTAAIHSSSAASSGGGAGGGGGSSGAG